MQYPKFSGRWGSTAPTKIINPVVTGPTIPAPVHRPAKFVPHQGTAKHVPQYTGDRMIGVAVMHKSCLQPMFSQEQAVDAAHMRR